MTATKKQKDLATAWKLSKDALDLAKVEESRLRKELVESFFGGDGKLAKGVNKAEIDKGWIVKATPAFNYKIDEAKLPFVLKMIKEKFNLKPDVVRTKLELKEGDYNKLDDAVKEMFNDCLTINPGTTQVEIALPKR